MRPPQPTHSLPERLLRQSKLTLLVVDRGEIGQRPAVSPGRSDLVEDLERLPQVALGLVGLALPETATVDGERVAHRLTASARLGQRLRLLQQRDRAGGVTAHAQDRGQLRSGEAL